MGCLTVGDTLLHSRYPIVCRPMVKQWGHGDLDVRLSGFQFFKKRRTVLIGQSSCGHSVSRPGLPCYRVLGESWRGKPKGEQQDRRQGGKSLTIDGAWKTVYPAFHGPRLSRRGWVAGGLWSALSFAPCCRVGTCPSASSENQRTPKAGSCVPTISRRGMCLTGQAGHCRTTARRSRLGSLPYPQKWHGIPGSRAATSIADRARRRPTVWSPASSSSVTPSRSNQSPRPHDQLPNPSLSFCFLAIAPQG